MTTRTNIRAVLAAIALLAGCGDDTVAVSQTDSGTGSTGGTTGTTGTLPTTSATSGPTTDATTSLPTTSLPTTSASTTDETTTEAITSSTGGSTGETTGGSTEGSTGTTTDTTGDTDSTTGAELVGRSQSQCVNAGEAVASENFRMVFTLGQPTTNQGTYDSPSFKLRGGLVGAIGEP